METLSTNIVDGLTSLLLLLLIIVVVFKIFTWPISIAKNKNLCSNEITTIRVLTWLGIFAGITWVIALCLAIAYKRND